MRRHKGPGWEWRHQSFLDAPKTWRVDTIIADPPFSPETHNGHRGGKRSNGRHVRELSYEPWTPADVTTAVAAWVPRCKGWICVLTDHVLAPYFRAELEAHGRYPFAPIPCVQRGRSVRMRGDGPSSLTDWLVVARPRRKPWSSWGTLPGYYVSPRSAARVYPGEKPLPLMRAIVSDYSPAGGVVWDPCGGRATTVLAAAHEGRRGIGTERLIGAYRLGLERLESALISHPLELARWQPGDFAGDQLELGAEDLGA